MIERKGFIKSDLISSWKVKKKKEKRPYFEKVKKYLILKILS